jgi:energy-coupling factor transporter ATP-binding protein EcfA2
MTPDAPATLDCLSWSWILGYGPDNLLDFSGLRGKLVAITGRNGGGKTALLHAAHIAMFGRSMEELGMSGVFNVTAPREVERSRVALVFRSEGNRYLLRREFTRGGASAVCTLHLVDANGGVGELVADGPGAVDREATRMFGRYEDAQVCNFAIDGDRAFNVPEEVQDDIAALTQLAGTCSAVLEDTTRFEKDGVSVAPEEGGGYEFSMKDMPVYWGSHSERTGLSLAMRVARGNMGLPARGADHFFCDQYVPEGFIDLLRGVLTVGNYASVLFTAPRPELANKADIVTTTEGNKVGDNSLRFGEWPLSVAA